LSQIKKYIWITPFEELKTRFGAQGGDFATAYVAHEIGHHVQTLMGTSSKCDNCNKVNQKLKLINYL
jgi:predicted metalloprotease